MVVVVRTVVADESPEFSVLLLDVLEGALAQHHDRQPLHLLVVQEVALEAGDLALAHDEAHLPDVVYQSAHHFPLHLAQRTR